MNDKRKKFSIRKKVTIAVLIFSLFFSLLISFFSIKVILKSYEVIEDGIVDINIKRVKFSIKYLIETQTVKLKDWSIWDDTYDFVKDKNSDYIEDNLQNLGLVNLNINFMIFMDDKGEIVYTKIIDLETGEDLDNDLISKFFKEKNNLSFFSKDLNNMKSGIIDTPYGLSIISSSPILHNDGSGPRSGTLIFGNFLNDNTFEEMSNLIMYPISVFNYYGDLPEDIIIARENFLEDDNYIEILSRNDIAGYFKLKDVQNEPVSIVKITITRDFYLQGLKSFSTFILISSLLFLLFALGSIYMLEAIILKKFSKLTNNIREIKVDSSFEKRVEVTGSDEFTDLSKSINEMMDKIKYLRDREKLSLEQEKKAVNDLKTHIERTEKLNKLMIKRELKMIELKKEIENLKKSNNL